MSDPSGSSTLCHLCTETAREVDKNLPGRAEQVRTQIPPHEPKVERGAMGILVSPFQGAKSSAKYTPSRVVLRGSLASSGSADYRMAANPH